MENTALEQLPSKPAIAKALGLSYYFTGKECKRGHLTKRHLNGVCYQCGLENTARINRADPSKGAARQRAYRARNPEAARTQLYEWRKRNPDKVAEAAKRSIRKNYKAYLLRAAKARCKDSGREFNLTVDDIEIPERCPALGIELICLPPKELRDHSPTLDRIDNKKGYVRGNVCVISMRANYVKHSSSLDELEKLVHYIKSRL